MLEKAAKDLAPGQLERVRRLLDRWDEGSKRELVRLLGEERARQLMRELGIP
jgi:type II secretory pathway predicted ATPase ExeA